MKKIYLLLLTLFFISSAAWAQDHLSRRLRNILNEYHHVGPVAENGLIMVCKKDTEHCGCIDTMGNEVVPFIYGMNFFYFLSEQPQFNSANRMVAAKPVSVTQAVYGIIDEKGNTILPFQYKTDYGDFHPLDGYHIFNTYKEPHLYGVVDSLGKIVIPFKYDKIEKAGLNRFITKKENKSDLLSAKGNEFSVLGTKGETILGPHFENIIYNETLNLLFVQQNIAWGVYTPDGEEILPAKYHSLNFSTYGYLIASTETAMEFYSPEGKLIKSFKVDYHIKPTNAKSKTPFPILLKQNGKIGAINSSLEISVPVEYDYISSPKYFAYPNEAVFHVKKEDKEAFIDTTNNLLSSIWFDSVSYGGLVKKDSLWGWVNLQGELQIPVQYENLKVIQQSDRHYPINQKQEFYFITTKNGQTALFDYDNKWLLSYDAGIENIHSVYLPPENKNTFIIFKKEGKYGAVDITGKTAIPFEYDKVESDFMLYERFMGHYRFYKGKKAYLVDWGKLEMVKQ